jgi:hypothetical protein
MTKTETYEERAKALFTKEPANMKLLVELEDVASDAEQHAASAHRLGKLAGPPPDYMMRWSRLSGQIFRVDKWSVCQG